MLTGNFLPSSGDAWLYGLDIKTQQLEVRAKLGYCPQHDALLDLLTVREHLQLFGRIKGVAEKDLSRYVETVIKDMDLTEFANKLAGRLSGGNKRKLSVGIATIGRPPIVFLDEPSKMHFRSTMHHTLVHLKGTLPFACVCRVGTGMDPGMHHLQCTRLPHEYQPHSCIPMTSGLD